MYRVYQNQATAAYSSLYFPFFFLSNFQTWKFFVTLSSRTVRPRSLTLVTHMENGWMYRVYQNHAAALIHPFIFSFFFLSNFQTLKVFVTLFSGTVRPRRLKLGTRWTVGRCIVYIGIRLLLHLHPFISSIFLLSNFLTLKFFITLFSGTVRPRRLKLGTHVDSVQMYRVYQNQAAAAYLSLYSPFFFLSNFQTWKFFVNLSSRTVRPRSLKLVTHVENGWMYRVYRNHAAALIRPFIFSFFSNFQTLKIFVTLFSGNVRPGRLKLGTHMDSRQMYRVYRNHAAALIHPFIFSFFFLSNFQTLKFFVTLFSGTVRPRSFKLGTYLDSGQMYHVYRNQATAAYSSFYFFIFLSLNFSLHFSQEMWGLEGWNLVHMWTVGRCIVYTGIRLPLFIRPFISVVSVLVLQSWGTWFDPLLQSFGWNFKLRSRLHHLVVSGTLN